MTPWRQGLPLKALFPSAQAILQAALLIVSLLLQWPRVHLEGMRQVVT